MILKKVYAIFIKFTLFIAGFLTHHTTVDMDNEKDLKKLNRITDLFMMH